MAYVKVAVKKKTGPKPKAKPIDPVTLMSSEEKLDNLKIACKALIDQFKVNDSTMKQVHTTSAKIKNYNLEEIKNKGMNPEYFRMISNKADGLTVEQFIDSIPPEKRDVYLNNERFISKYITMIKNSGTAMVNKANVVRDLIKEVKKYDTNGNGKLAKLVLDYYRKIYNAEKELKESLAEINGSNHESVDTLLNKYDFIKELYLED